MVKCSQSVTMKPVCAQGAERVAVEVAARGHASSTRAWPGAGRGRHMPGVAHVLEEQQLPVGAQQLVDAGEGAVQVGQRAQHERAHDGVERRRLAARGSSRPASTTSTGTAASATRRRSRAAMPAVGLERGHGLDVAVVGEVGAGAGADLEHPAARASPAGGGDARPDRRARTAG